MFIWRKNYFLNWFCWQNWLSLTAHLVLPQMHGRSYVLAMLPNVMAQTDYDNTVYNRILFYHWKIWFWCLVLFIYFTLLLIIGYFLLFQFSRNIQIDFLSGLSGLLCSQKTWLWQRPNNLNLKIMHNMFSLNDS